MPKYWINPSNKFKTASKIRTGYIDTFDPDFILSRQAKTLRYEDNITRGNISIAEFWQYAKSEQTPSIGISIYEIAEHMYRSEMKFIQKDPPTFIFPQYTNEYSLFFSAVFGTLPEVHYNHFVYYFEKVLEIKHQKCDLKDFYKLLTPRNQFLRRISQYRINSKPLGRKNDVIYLLDAKSPSDIFDYWNLRALGWNIIPIPIQTMEEAEFLDFAIDFIRNAYYLYGYNHQNFHNAILQKSRSIDKKYFTKFSEFLSSKLQTDKTNPPNYMVRDWFPSIWDQEAMPFDEQILGFVEYQREKISFNKLPEKLSFTTPRLDVMKEFGSFGKTQYAVDIDYRIYGAEALFAEVLPEATRKLAQHLGAFEIDEWRFSKSGLVHLCRHTDWLVELQLPLAEYVFKHWFTEKGWHISLSVPGKVGHQILKHLGGIWGTGLLMDVRTINMLSEMCEDHHKTANEVRAVAARRVNEQKYGNNKPETIINNLIKCNALALGIESQCTVCEQRSWFSLKEFDYTLRCPKCLSEFSPPLAKPTEMNWAYKAIGPFNLPKKSFGLYTVLLTLKFFSINFDLSTTPMLCFNAIKKDIQIEADLAILFRRHRFNENRIEPSLLFAECKTFNDFTKKDIDRLNVIMNNFPNAYIVLATLRDTFKPEEVRMIKSLAIKGRKCGADLKPRNPIIILTGEQLFENWWPPGKWAKKEDPFATIYASASHKDVDSLFDVTQQIYLGLEPWQDCINKYIQKLKHNV
jgi:hypothetical protein